DQHMEGQHFVVTVEVLQCSPDSPVVGACAICSNLVCKHVQVFPGQRLPLFGRPESGRAGAMLFGFGNPVDTAIEVRWAWLHALTDVVFPQESARYPNCPTDSIGWAKHAHFDRIKWVDR